MCLVVGKSTQMSPRKVPGSQVFPTSALNLAQQICLGWAFNYLSNLVPLKSRAWPLAFSSPPLQGTGVSLHWLKRRSGFCTWLPVACYSSGAVHHLHAGCVVTASAAIILPATHRKPHSISQASVLPSTHTPSLPASSQK